MTCRTQWVKQHDLLNTADYCVTGCSGVACLEDKVKGAFAQRTVAALLSPTKKTVKTEAVITNKTSGER